MGASKEALPVSRPASGPRERWAERAGGWVGGQPTPGAPIGTGCFTLAASRCGCW